MSASAPEPRSRETQRPTVLLETEQVPVDVLQLAERIGAQVLRKGETTEPEGLLLRAGPDGLSLEDGGRTMRCDWLRMLPRLRRPNLSRELLIRAAKRKHAGEAPVAVDATAGLGEDSLLLAAAGFSVKLYERNPVIAALLRDALSRAAESPELAEIVARMELFEADSLTELPRLSEQPEVVYLDPMFPEKTKNSLAGKKFQLLHQVELPCGEEEELLQAALAARPFRVVIKRPLKGAFLGGRKPDFSLKGKAIRYDCILLPENAAPQSPRA